MRKSIIFLLTLSSHAIAYDAFSIGVSGVENTLHSATFYNNQLLYGIDFAHFSFNSEITEKEGYVVTQWNDAGISVNIFMPRLGFRMPVKNIDRINTYNQIEGYLILPMVKGKGDAEESIEEYEDEIHDALTLLGIKLSHAVEYEFHPQLSLTASVGLNWIYWDYNQQDADGYGESLKTELSANLSYTYTMLALHFKF